MVTFPPRTTGARQEYRFRMADGRHGERLEGTVRFQIFHIDLADRINIDINGSPIATEAVKRDHRPEADPPTTWFEINLSDSPSLRGDNELGMTPLHLGAKTEQPYMEELEVRVE